MKAYHTFVLHHEYIHALGLEHNSKFGFMENRVGNRASKHEASLLNFYDLKMRHGYGVVLNAAKIFLERKPQWEVQMPMRCYIKG